MTDELLYLDEVSKKLLIPVGTLQRWHATGDPRCEELGLRKNLNGRLVCLRSKVEAQLPTVDGSVS